MVFQKIGEYVISLNKKGIFSTHIDGRIVCKHSLQSIRNEIEAQHPNDKVDAFHVYNNSGTEVVSIERHRHGGFQKVGCNRRWYVTFYKYDAAIIKKLEALKRTREAFDKKLDAEQEAILDKAVPVTEENIEDIRKRQHGRVKNFR